jgi:hypothetical protein
MSEIATRERSRSRHRPIKAWLFAAVLFVFGVRLLSTHDDSDGSQGDVTRP